MGQGYSKTRPRKCVL